MTDQNGNDFAPQPPQTPQAGQPAPPQAQQPAPPSYPAPAAPPAGYQAPPAGYAEPQPGYAAPQPGYAAPQPGYAAPQQGYVAPQAGYAVGQQPYAAAPATGRTSWALTFLLYIPIPVVNAIAAIIAVLVSRGNAKKTGSPQAIGNANAASNFILSFVLYFIVLYLAVVTIGVTTAGDGGDPSPLIILPSLLILAAGIWALIWMIIGVVKSPTRVVNAVPVIPFFRTN